jgi:hypothetical protein
VRAVDSVDGVEGVDEDVLARFGVERRARYTVVEPRFVDIRCDESISIRDRISWVEVFSVDEGLNAALYHRVRYRVASSGPVLRIASNRENVCSTSSGATEL